MESVWYGPWTTILTTLFPATDGFQVAPQRKLVDNESTTPDYIIEVSKVTAHGGLDFQGVLIVGIKNSQHWPDGVERLLVQICKQANSAFSQAARGKLYWIAVISPHWRYGSKDDDGQLKLSPLIPWRHTTHDDISFNDLQTVAGLVGAL
ncbi:hypothetical protein APHAL10511_002477 [Amanita phalloides]|nr:hypothetical protein APHAL10511_002477 [Amanita phalloides]